METRDEVVKRDRDTPARTGLARRPGPVPRAPPASDSTTSSTPVPAPLHLNNQNFLNSIGNPRLINKELIENFRLCHLLPVIAVSPSTWQLCYPSPPLSESWDHAKLSFV